MPQPGIDGHPTSHGHGESFQLDGYGLTLRYTPSHLRVTWENQSEIAIRPAGSKITVNVETIHLNVVKVVMLSLKVEIAVPDPGTGGLQVLLAFPPHLEGEVRRLADGIRGDAEAGPPPADRDPAPNHALPHQLALHQPAPHQRPAPPQPPPLPMVRFLADLTAWTDHPDWIGLYPSLETAQLIVTQPAKPSPETSPYP